MVELYFALPNRTNIREGDRNGRSFITQVLEAGKLDLAIFPDSGEYPETVRNCQTLGVRTELARTSVIALTYLERLRPECAAVYFPSDEETSETLSEIEQDLISEDHQVTLIHL